MAKFVRGDRVALGNGDLGRIVKECIGPTGFKSYHVQIEASKYPLYVGRRVYATVNGMARVASLDAIPDVTTEFRDGIGRHLAVVGCELMTTDSEHIVGLQKYSSLSPDAGMLFAFSPARPVTFHMGRVTFPIDVIYVGDDGLVCDVLPNKMPGDTSLWRSRGRVASVVEVNGGFCDSHRIGRGVRVNVRTVHIAQEMFDPLRPDIPDRKPTDIRPDAPDRFKGRDLPDIAQENLGLDDAHWQEDYGYQSSDPSHQQSTDTEAHDFTDDAYTGRPH